MRCVLIRLVLALAALALVPACGRGGRATGSTPAPPVQAGARELTVADVEMFVTVRAKAISRLETDLARAEADESWSVARIAELSAAEQDAVGALGFDWRRYRWVREEVARLLSVQRQHEDAQMLTLELTRARDDLLAQLKLARDPASRQFLEAQAASLDTQLAKLAGGAEVSAGDTRGLDMIAKSRADMAVQQGRQDRISKRIRELVQRERAGGTAAATPNPTAAR